MDAMILEAPSQPLHPVELPDRQPGPGELHVRVLTSDQRARSSCHPRSYCLHRNTGYKYSLASSE